MKIFRLWKKILCLFVTALGCSSVILAPVYGALPPMNPSLFLSHPDSPLPHKDIQKTTEKLKKELSEFYHWFKEQIHFPLTNGINEKSRQKVLLGLNNMRALFSGVDYVQTNITPKTSYLEQLQLLSDNYLKLFQQLSDQELIGYNHYQQLHKEYTDLLKDSSVYYLSHLSNNRILETIVRETITQEKQAAALSTVFFLSCATFLFSLAFYLQSGIDRNTMVNKKKHYVENIILCDIGALSNVSTDLYSDSKLNLFCGSYPEDQERFTEYINKHFYFHFSNQNEHRDKLCSLVKELKNCMIHHTI